MVWTDSLGDESNLIVVAKAYSKASAKAGVSKISRLEQFTLVLPSDLRHPQTAAPLRLR